MRIHPVRVGAEVGVRVGIGPNSDPCGSDTDTLTLALALTMALTLALTRNVLPELAGREWFAESSGVKRVRVALVKPARLAPAASSGPERVELAELAVLAEMADDKTVAALQDIVSPGHAGSTCTPAQASAHGGSMPAQANQQMQMHAVPVCVELVELASDKETVAAPQGIVSPGHAGTGHARAPVGVPWAASTDQRKSHWEAKRTDSSSASVTTSAHSYRSSSSSDVSGPAPGSTATPAPPLFGAPAVPSAAPVAPPPLPADFAQMFDDEPIGLGTTPAAPLAASAAPAVSSHSWLEQQQLAEMLEEELTGVEAVEVSKV